MATKKPVAKTAPKPTTVGDHGPESVVPEQDSQSFALDGNTSGAQPTSGPPLANHDEWTPDSDLTPGQHLDATSELPAELPTDGYVWVQRKKTAVQLGVLNYTDDGPQLIDAKSLPELALQGYVLVDPPKDEDK